LGNLLQVVGGAKAFGARSLFQDATFAIDEGERVGVIGPNGAGKSTLFRILAGLDELDAGSIARAQGLRLGYLEQEDKWDTAATVDATLSGCAESPPWELKRLAARLGVGPALLPMPLASLSGGYRMRVKLALMLGRKPGLMLLDEPTNYLDLETTLALERFLLDAPCAFFLISHDREFLRRTTDHILEIEAGDVTKFNGGLDDYFEQKALLREQLEKRALSSAGKRREILDFVAKFGAKATKARQAQSRLKALDKMEAIETRPALASARVRIPPPARTGKRVLELEDCAFGYGGRAVLRDVRLEIARGDRVAIVGINGAGKSTLLKALAGELPPLSGEVKRGLDARVAYFAQHVAERLEPGDSVVEAMGARAHPGVSRQEILDLAGSLLFSGDAAAKRVRVLSGGEKSRVALGQALLQRAPCLLLDEPTNHLDFGAVEALAQGLTEFEGTVVIVSHDRSFVRRTATKILEIRDGRASIYPGTYDEYVWSVQKGAWREADATASGGRAPAGGGAEADGGALRAGVAEGPRGTVEPAPAVNFKDEKKRLERERRALEKAIAANEAATEEVRSEILALTKALERASGEDAGRVARSLAAAQAKIDALEAEWLEKSGALEEARAALAGLMGR
jgi:ATP-binding cassette subfamily F protein 3